jgi:hypothetical protein
MLCRKNNKSATLPTDARFEPKIAITLLNVLRSDPRFTEKNNWIMMSLSWSNQKYFVILFWIYFRSDLVKICFFTYCMHRLVGSICCVLFSEFQQSTAWLIVQNFENFARENVFFTSFYIELFRIERPTRGYPLRISSAAKT